jgi:hypothetical protein
MLENGVLQLHKRRCYGAASFWYGGKYSAPPTAAPYHERIQNIDTYYAALALAKKMTPLLKETVSRDFRPLGFFINQLSLGLWVTALKYFRILYLIRGDIREYVLCYIARSHDSPLCNIALSRLRAMQHSAESKLHSAESKLHSAESVYKATIKQKFIQR